MKKLLIILGLLFLTAGVQADVSGPTFLGTKLGIDAVYASAETLYTTEDFTDIITVGDILVIRHDLENSTVSPWIAVVASEDPAYIELMGAWPGSDRTDGQAYFFHNNYQVMVGSAAGDGYDSYIDGSGNAVYTGDMNIQGDLDVDTDLNVDGAAVIDGTLRLGLNAALKDTTGFVGGEVWFSATGDTTYKYTSDHEIVFCTFKDVNSFAIAQFDSISTPVPLDIQAGYTKISNLSEDLWELTESSGITVSADSLIASDLDHKRLRAIFSVKGQNSQDFNFKFVTTGGGTVATYIFPLETAATALERTVILFGHWQPSKVGEALTIEGDDLGGATDLTLYSGFWEVSFTGH